ncbi:MAG: hypothetical protein QNJ87_09955 [Gammaproteobacteria bacterium]|nr:hypothetical protein [Gammaproteobacteria bacterium]
MSGMLELYGRIGKALFGVRRLLLVGVALSAAAFAAALLDVDAAAQETRLLLPLLVCLWLLCLTVFGYGFSGAIPAPTPGMGWWRRLMTRARQAVWHFMALVIMGLGLATVVFTLKAITVMRNELGLP